MITHIGWWSPAAPHKWILVDPNMTDEEVRIWAEEHPSHIFFFVTITTDIE